jgi:hypothetical protein
MLHITPVARFFFVMWQALWQTHQTGSEIDTTFSDLHFHHQDETMERTALASIDVRSRG